MKKIIKIFFHIIQAAAFVGLLFFGFQSAALLTEVFEMSLWDRIMNHQSLVHEAFQAVVVTAGCAIITATGMSKIPLQGIKAAARKSKTKASDIQPVDFQQNAAVKEKAPAGAKVATHI